MAGIVHPEQTLPLVGHIPDFIYVPVLNYIDEIGSPRQPTLRSSSINAQAPMIATGAGFGVLPCFIGDQDLRLQRVRPGLVVQRTFWLAVHQDSADSPVLLDISRKLTLPAALQSAPLGFLSALFLVELRFSQQHTQGFK